MCSTFLYSQRQYEKYMREQGLFWNTTRKKALRTWTLIAVTAILVAITGVIVKVLTEAMNTWKFDVCYGLIQSNSIAKTFFAYLFICLFFAACAGTLCWWQPAAVGPGVPEVKAYLNGVDLTGAVTPKVLAAKVIGMCCSVASGIPLGKEGPMIHSGAAIGATVSEPGNAINHIFDSSWNLFHNIRDDRKKLEFVTYGAAAGVTAALGAPIAGVLFAVEEGASFWGVKTTFRVFVCVTIAKFMYAIWYPYQTTKFSEMYDLGFMENFFEDHTNFRTYELPIFILIGILGGLFGALYIAFNRRFNTFRKTYLSMSMWKRMIELACVTTVMALLSFFLPLLWPTCTALPTDTSSLSEEAIELLDKLVQFRCPAGSYNPLASLYFTSAHTTLHQLFHFHELDGSGNSSFGAVTLILFFIPYYLMATITNGTLAPGGLFVPTMLSGAAMGRLIGHWLNLWFSGHVADAGTYALIGAAAMMAGVTRLTIAAAVMVLEVSGNTSYLLPLMITVVAARYVGDVFNESFYDMQIRLKEMPYLEGSLQNLGSIHGHPISEIMTSPVVTLHEVDRVSRVMEVLTNTTHNGFPLVGPDGRLRGLVLRKTLCILLKHKAFSAPVQTSQKSGGLQLVPASPVRYAVLESTFPKHADIQSISLCDDEMVRTVLPSLPFVVMLCLMVAHAYYRTAGWMFGLTWIPRL
jgi:chloride channel 7